MGLCGNIHDYPSNSQGKTIVSLDPRHQKRGTSPLLGILDKKTEQVSVTDDCGLEPLEKGDNLYPEVVLGVLNLKSPC